MLHKYDSLEECAFQAVRTALAAGLRPLKWFCSRECSEVIRLYAPLHHCEVVKGGFTYMGLPVEVLREEDLPQGYEFSLQTDSFG